MDATAISGGALGMMAAPDLVNLSALLDDAKCFALVRQHRWPDGVCCPGCGDRMVVRDGCDDTQPHRQRYRCKACAGRFDDLTGTVLAGHHQPLRVWVLCLYFMGLNLICARIEHFVPRMPGTGVVVVAPKAVVGRCAGPPGPGVGASR
jgi:transposase-like protein